jgi:hypothetical protein
MAKKELTSASNTDIRIMALAFPTIKYNIDGNIVFDYIAFRDCVETRNELLNKSVDALMEKFKIVQDPSGGYSFSDLPQSAIIDKELEGLLALEQPLKPTHFITLKQLTKLVDGNPGQSDRLWKILQKYLVKTE